MIDKKIAIKNIVDIQRIIPSSFAVYGTALGIVREGDIISHDLDTDIGIFNADFKWEFISELIKNGFKIINFFGMRTYGMEIAVARDGVKTDLMIFYEDPDGTIWNSLWENGCRNGMSDEIKHVYTKEIFKTETRMLAGNPVKTVGTRYLEHVYGNWQVPITKWNWRTDHKCIKK